MTYTLWFMGRPAAGKSTIAKRVEEQLRDRGEEVENLDGDEVRQHLHPDLGFSREDRELNNRRTAFICRLLNRNGIVAVTGMITPFRDAQRQVRNIIEPDGDFVLIYVKCSVEGAAERDPKDLYQKAREGKIEKFTGVNHPFQGPHNPEIIVDTEEMSVEESVSHVLEELEKLDVSDSAPEEDYSFDISKGRESEILSNLENRGYLNDSEKP